MSELRDQTLPVRVRFAPSPTGFLHVGGVRTAIFNWLFARQRGGAFILRVDDTDIKRNLEEGVRVILDGLRWIGLDWDEGPDKGGPYGPYFPSQRTDKYHAAGKRLEASGRARWLKKERKGELPAWKVEKLKKSGQWDEDLAQAEADPRPALYFSLHRGEPAPISFQDAVWGAYTTPPELLPDVVLLRGDGTPTYNFASAVDDIEMRITHVIRGGDHLANTCKQIPIFEALGAPVPVFAHLPMIHNEKGEKISKRRDPVAMTLYQGCGLLPEAFLNFLALLGWSPGDNRELMSKEELIRSFGLDRVKQSPAQFALKRKRPLPPEAGDDERVRWLSESLPGTKLEWMNGEYMKRLPAAELARRAAPFMKASGYDMEGRPPQWLENVVALGQGRARTLLQLAEVLRLFFVAPSQYEEKSVQKYLRSGNGLALLGELRSALDGIETWTAAELEAKLEQVAASRKLKFGDVAQPIRVALAGAAVSPPIHETLALLGKEESLRRMAQALTRLQHDAAWGRNQ
jgi:glutamyl-tRNA synthetase